MLYLKVYIRLTYVKRTQFFFFLYTNFKAVLFILLEVLSTLWDTYLLHFFIT